MSKYLYFKKACHIFEQYAELTDAPRYFSREEINENKKIFMFDLMNGCKSHYIDFLRNEIGEIIPAGVYGCYDLDLIREYRELLKQIEAF